jgi:hypothetical protein
MDQYIFFHLVLVVGMTIGLYLNLGYFSQKSTNKSSTTNPELQIICQTLNFISEIDADLSPDDINRIQHQITAQMVKLDSINQASLKPLRKEVIRYLDHVSCQLES